MSPCPEGFYLVVKIILQLCFDDALDGGIVVTNAFNAGGLVDYIGNAIAFADGFGRAFGYASAASDAVFKNFHGHGSFSVNRFGMAIKLPDMEYHVK
jgi:hypothetical protein